MGEVPAGSRFDGQLSDGNCVRVFTGSWLPAGADAVVMQEDVEVEATAAGPATATATATATANGVRFREAIKPWENVRFQGEDVRRGRTVLASGEWLTVGRLSLLGALGCERVSVSRQPHVAVLATGSELAEPGTELKPGWIFESNRLGLAAAVTRAGGVPLVQPIVPDDLKAIQEALRAALAHADAVVTSGGVSVGTHDLLRPAFEALGGQVEFWKVDMRPGRPFVFGRLGAKLWFGLPGNPVSALVTFHLLVRPALLRLQGASQLAPLSHPGVLAEPLMNRANRRHFMRVRVDDRGEVRSAGTQASHILSSLALADGLLDLPPGASWPAGSVVEVLRWS
jgi:molybdopterin molybdotransferase